MSSKGISPPQSRRRRSPRLAQAVAVRIAGKGADGRVFQESTQTCEISRHGASLTTRNPFAVGSPMAIRRPGAQPMRARVVSAKPGPEPGLLQVGLEFVGEEGNWDFEFPREWQDTYRATAEDEMLAAARRGIQALDASQEALVRKAETLRAQAEGMLQEFAAQVEAARGQGAAALASQLEAFTAGKSSLEREFSEQARAAAEALRAALAQQAGLEEKFASLQRQWQAALEAGQEQYRQILMQEGQKALKIVAYAAGQLEAHRKGLAELESQAAGWREEATNILGSLRRELERLIESSRSDMGVAALAAVKEFRQRIPELGEEANRFVANLLAEQKTAGAEWIGQSLETIRAGLAGLENQSRAALGENVRQALEQFQVTLQNRLQEAGAAADGIASALEARLQRARNALGEFTDWSERALSGAQAELAAAAAREEDRLREISAQRLAEFGDAAAQGFQRLDQLRQALKAGAAEAARMLEQRYRELQQLGAMLDQNAAQKREELTALFASLMARYEQRKEALDRLLETLEDGRAALRAGRESLRTSAEENQAWLLRFRAEQEAALEAKTMELERKLGAASVALEAALQERAAASLQSFHHAFSAGLEKAVAQARQKFQGLLDTEVEEAAARLSEISPALERRAREQQQALAQAAASALEEVARRAAEGMDAIRQATLLAAGEVENHQVRAVAAAREVLAEIQRARGARVREHAEMVNQVQQRQQALEAQFAALASGLEQKGAALDSFCSYTDQARARLQQSLYELDRRVEEARSALHELQRETQVSLDQRGAALAQQLQQSLHDCQQELEAMGEAAQGVCQERVRALADQAVEEAWKLLRQAGDNWALTLERALEKEGREHQRRRQELGQQAEETVRQQKEMLRESAAAEGGSLEEQVQQAGRLAMERVRETQEMFLREIPARATEAELAFRQDLERIRQQTVEDAAVALSGISSQWLARFELELSQRLREILPGASPVGGDGGAQ